MLFSQSKKSSGPSAPTNGGASLENNMLKISRFLELLGWSIWSVLFAVIIIVQKI